MGDVLEALDDKLIDWIGQQHVFFVATAPTDGGHVNLSPKGHDALRVLDDGPSPTSTSPAAAPRPSPTRGRTAA